MYSLLVTGKFWTEQKAKKKKKMYMTNIITYLSVWPKKKKKEKRKKKIYNNVFFPKLEQDFIRTNSCQ